MLCLKLSADCEAKELHKFEHVVESIYRSGGFKVKGFDGVFYVHNGDVRGAEFSHAQDRHPSN